MRTLVLMTAFGVALAGQATVFAGELKAEVGEGSGTAAVLVEKLVVVFEQMATSKARVDPVLDDLMAFAKKARAEQRVDERFYVRYTRLLRVFKLVTLEDREGILKPIADRECTQFIKDIEGTSPAECTVPAVAKAITHELQSLKE